MPRKRTAKSPCLDRPSADEDDDFFYDDSQSASGGNGQEPQHRNAANARERARMRVLSKAFCRLKTTLPWVPADTKLSKLDTLRLAASYIAHLRATLRDEPDLRARHHPLNLAWPFGFQHSSGASASSATSPKPGWIPSPPNDNTPPPPPTGSRETSDCRFQERSYHNERTTNQEVDFDITIENNYRSRNDEIQNGDSGYFYGGNVGSGSFINRNENGYALRNSYSDSLIRNME